VGWRDQKMVCVPIKLPSVIPQGGTYEDVLYVNYLIIIQAKIVINFTLFAFNLLVSKHFRMNL